MMRTALTISVYADLNTPPPILDLFVRLLPKKKKPHAKIKAWTTHPDMHGNAIYLLYRLMSCGILENPDCESAPPDMKIDGSIRKITTYEQLKKIYVQHSRVIASLQSGDSNERKQAKTQLIKDIADFKALLNTIDIKNNTLAVRLIGDLLADRGENDIFTLLILNHLHQKDVPLEIILSNHDAAFIEALIKNVLGDPVNNTLQYIGTPKHGYSRSLDNLSALINAGVITKAEVKSLANNCYFPNLKQFSHDHDDERDQPILYSHAPVNFTVTHDVATIYKTHKPYQDDTEQDFSCALDDINQSLADLIKKNKLCALLESEYYSADKHQTALKEKRIVVYNSIIEQLVRLSGEITPFTATSKEAYLKKHADKLRINVNAFFVDEVNCIETLNKTLSENAIALLKTIRENIQKLSELSEAIDHHKVYYRDAPINSAIWSRISRVSETPHKTDDPNIITEYEWPSTGWKSKAINVHGHAGPGGSVLDKNGNMSANHINLDGSNLGKNALYFQGEMFLNIVADKKALTKMRGADLSDSDLSDSDLSDDDLPPTPEVEHMGKTTETKPLPQQETAPASEAVKLNWFLLQLHKGIKNFSGADLSGLNLSKLDLSNCNFTNADLQNADLTDCNLCGAQLKYAKMANATVDNILINVETDFNYCNALNQTQESIFKDDLKIRFKPFQNSRVLFGTVKEIFERYVSTYQRILKNELEGKLTTQIAYLPSLIRHGLFSDKKTSPEFSEHVGFVKDVLEKKSTSLMGKFCFANEHARNNPSSRSHDAFMFMAYLRDAPYNS